MLAQSLYHATTYPLRTRLNEQPDQYLHRTLGIYLYGAYSASSKANELGMRDMQERAYAGVSNIC